MYILLFELFGVILVPEITPSYAACIARWFSRAFLLYAASSAVACPLHTFLPTTLAFPPSFSFFGSLAFWAVWRHLRLWNLVLPCSLYLAPLLAHALLLYCSTGAVESRKAVQVFGIRLQLGMFSPDRYLRVMPQVWSQLLGSISHQHLPAYLSWDSMGCQQTG